MTTGKNPAFIGAIPEDEAVGRERLYGFLDANFELDREIREEYCTNGPFSIENGYESAKKLFAMDDTIDTLICATDKIAIGAVRYLKEIGKKIPEEVQVTGFGDSLLASVCEPNISTVHFYYQTSGEEAANMLVNMIVDNKSVRKEMKMGYQIVKTKSLR